MAGGDQVAGVGIAMQRLDGGAGRLQERALGIALLGSIGTAVYRGGLTDRMPADVPPATAATARDTLGGAVEAAGQLPDQLGVALLDAAQTAFIQGLQLTAAIGVAVMLGTAVLAVALLRNVRPSSESAEQPEHEAAGEPEPEPAVHLPAAA